MGEIFSAETIQVSEYEQGSMKKEQTNKMHKLILD